MLNDEQLRILGQDIVDKADNFLQLAFVDMPAIVLLDAFEQGLKEIRDTAKKLYIEISSENPWSDSE